MNGELRELARRASDQKVQADQTRPRAAGAALLSVCLGFFVIQLDATIVNVALPAIQREIGGSLAARFGPRPPMIAGLTLAAAGLHVPLAVATAAALSAAALAWVAIQGTSRQNASRPAKAD